MIKIILILSLFVFPVWLQAQKTFLPVDENGVVTFEEVVKTDTSSKAIDLYGRAVKWFTETYSAHAIQTKVPETNSISGNGFTTITLPSTIIGSSSHDMTFKMTIASKDGRYKYTITDIKFVSYTDLESIQKKDSKQSEEVRLALIKKIKTITTSLQGAMGKNDAW